MKFNRRQITGREQELRKILILERSARKDYAYGKEQKKLYCALHKPIRKNEECRRTKN